MKRQNFLNIAVHSNACLNSKLKNLSILALFTRINSSIYAKIHA